MSPEIGEPVGTVSAYGRCRDCRLRERRQWRKFDMYLEWTLDSTTRLFTAILERSLYKDLLDIFRA